MKVPEKVVPLLFVLLLIAAYLLGRYQAQVELLKSGGARQLTDQAGTQQVGQPQGQQAARNEPLAVELWSKLLENPAAAKGDEDAPVTLVEFTDYQCPYCARFYTDTYWQLKKEYVETGKARYLIRDLPLPIHPSAPAAAMAARCAGDEGRYWEMHDLLFEKQDEWSSGDTEELFSGYAGELGLDVGGFSSCLRDEKYKQEVDEDVNLARQVGADGTPAFFINGRRLIGAQPFSAFQQVIEAEL